MASTSKERPPEQSPDCSSSSYMEHAYQGSTPSTPRPSRSPRGGMDTRVKLLLIAVIAAVCGTAVYVHSAGQRARSEFVSAFEAPPEQENLEEEAMQKEMQAREEQMRLAEEEQMALAQSLKPLYMRPPPPPARPAPPVFTRKQWEREQQRAEKEKLAREKLRTLHMERRVYNKQGDWYWKYSRAFTSNLHSPKRPQCFHNATARAADFWAPVEGTFVTTKHSLPIYDVDHLNTPKALCFTGAQKQVPLRGYKIRTCGADQWQPLLKQHFKGSNCQMKALYDDMLLALLRGHRLWFFGDFNTESIYKTLGCSMAPHRHGKGGKLPRGNMTGVSPIYQQFGFKGETAMYYVYVGPYQARASTGGHHVEGLGAELESRYGVDTAVQQDMDRHHELSDALRENFDRFRPTDVIVLNIGNDYKEPRRLQASLLKFLRLYQDHAERLPVVIWQESTAQHHIAFKGGDRNGARLVEREVDPLGLMEEELRCGRVEFQDLEAANWRNQLANRLVEAAGIPVMRVWKASTEYHNQYSRRCPSGHCTNFGPCRFYCWPGAMPTFMSELLISLLDSEPLQATLNTRADRTVPWWQQDGITLSDHV